MQDPNHNVSPVNDLPPLVGLLAAALALIEIAFQAGAAGLVGGPEAVGWRALAAQELGVFPQLVAYLAQTGAWDAPALARFVGYGAVHTEALHAVFAVVMLLALGKFVGERTDQGRLAVIILGSLIGGGVTYGWLGSGVLIGFFPAVYGLIGAFTALMLASARAMGAQQLSAFRLIGVLMAFRLAIGLLFGIQDTWIADIAGFVTGFGLMLLLAPGGLGNLLAKLRR